jgi:two-component system chemotaxis sensor kinase CheA
MDDELLTEFIEESKHGLQAIESDLLALESDSALDRSCVDRIFRAIHTIKGASAFLQLDNITSLSHSAESLLVDIREGRTKPSSSNVSIVLQSIDALSAMLEDHDLGESYQIDSLVAALEKAINDDGIGEAGGKAEASASGGGPAETSAVCEADQGDGQGPGGVAQETDRESSSSAATANVAPAGSRGADPNLRVPSSTLSHLLHVTGEMVMARNALLNSRDQENDPTLARLSRLISDVHETVLKTRKGTTGTLFNRFNRIVRDLCLSLGKEAKLEIEGGELELDRSIIDAFTDPLTHLVRNCVDHALEMPGEREELGKPRSGTIWLRSSLQSGEIVLEIEDDGRGIDADAIRTKAVNKGIISEQEADSLSSQEAIELIFSPGFSTKESATDLSGRGVGMDVVKTKIEEIGGAVCVESAPGRGTRISAHLPLAKALVTSSLTRTLVVGVGAHRFAIPDSAVCEIISPDRENYPRDFRTLEHGEVFHLRGEILPLLYLADDLNASGAQVPGQAGDAAVGATIGASQRVSLVSKGHGGKGPRPVDPPQNIVVVVIRHRNHRFALLVNDVYGIREAIVQPMPALLEHCALYTGHAVMGDGTCIFILDIGAIAQRNRLQAKEHVQGPENRILVTGAAKTERILVFDAGDGSQFAIPLELAGYVLPTSKAEFRMVGSTTYYPYQNRMLSLIYLDQYLDVPPPAFDRRPPNIILPAAIDLDIAIACGEDLDVVELGTCFQLQSDTQSCAIAHFEKDGTLVTLLDVFRLAEQHDPDAAHRSAETSSARLLCVDDSVFFRQLVMQYLDHPQWTVDLAEDGEQAWALLRDGGERYDVIISDINMPGMDGFALAERVRSHPELKDTPMIALTTQVDEQSRLWGLEVGFNRYVAKINKVALCECIERLLSEVTWREVTPGAKE